MNLETFLLSCQEMMCEEFELLRSGDRYLESDRGKLNIQMQHYSPDALIDSVKYSAFGVIAEFQVCRDTEGKPNYETIHKQLLLLVASRWMERHREIDVIEMYIRELDKIAKAPVTYIRRYGMRPGVAVVLDGTENLALFSITGTGIRYLPSRLAMGDEKHKAGQEVTVRSVAEIKAVPIEGFEKIMERRCGSRRMDIFVSENVEYIPPVEGENFGYVQVGLPCCDIMRIEPIVMGNKIVAFLRGCTVLDGLEITVAHFDLERRQTDPCKGHVLSAEFRLSSINNPEFALWFRLHDNAKLTMTHGVDETSALAGRLVAGYLEPIQLGLTN